MGQAYDSLHIKWTQLTALFEGMTSEHNDALAQLEAARARVNQLEQERIALHSEVSQAAARYARMERERADLASEMEQAAQRYARMETELANARSQIDGAQDQRKSVRA